MTEARAASPFDQLAPEYYDPCLHPTCADFRRASERLIESLVPAVDPNLSCEVGTGDSVLAPLLARREHPLDGLLLTDASPAMLAYSRQWEASGARLVTAEASALPVLDGSLGLVVASLADPYDDAALWSEIARVLGPGGQCVITTPSSTWAGRFRANGTAHDLAEFVLADGRRVDVPSWIREPAAEQNLIEDNRLQLVEIQSVELGSLDEPISPKLRVLSPDDPVIMGYVVRA